MNVAKPANGEILLEIRGLKVETAETTPVKELVRGVDLKLRRGEIVGLIGESGAGKSTIGLASMGYARSGCRISGGQILFDGMDLTELTEEERRQLRGSRIAYVAQSAASAFNPAHRLLKQCIEVPLQHRLFGAAEATRRAIDLFRQMKLPAPEHVGQRFPHQVSGGQLQRAMTSMAMICRPDLIIFDEPTTALDVTTQVGVLAAIRNAVQLYGASALYISHDLAVVAQMADRIIVLRHGAVVEEGATSKLINTPDQEYTKALLGVRRLSKPASAAALQEPLLRLRNVSVSYGSARVLYDIDLEVQRGRTMAIVGESGSGKSTMARAISGLRPPGEGEVLWQGRTLNPSFRGRTKSELRAIQMIYQAPDTALNPKHRVSEILGRPLSFYLGLRGRKREERIRQLLQLVELDPETFIHRNPGELSGGEKQRICIARALAAEPELVICDEVTSALDPLVAESVLNLLSRLQRELSLTYLIITHDISVVQALADEVTVLHRGRIVEQGDKDRVLSAPQNEYTRVLLASVPELRTTWLDDVLTRLGEEPGGDAETLTDHQSGTARERVAVDI